MFIIFEHLDLDDLLSVAQINGRFSTPAAYMFRRKFSHLIVWTTADFCFRDELDELLNENDMQIDYDTIKRTNMDLSHLLN